MVIIEYIIKSPEKALNVLFENPPEILKYVFNDHSLDLGICKIDSQFGFKLDCQSLSLSC